ncbi:MAG: metallophosphoesterase family protein [Jatrophihabitans sp.]
MTTEPTGARLLLSASHNRLMTAWRWQLRRRIGYRTLVCLTAIAGGLVAITLWGSVHSNVGPVRASFSLQPRWHGGTEIDIPPLGRLYVDSHSAPVRLKATVTGVDLAAAQRALHGQLTTDQIEAQVTSDVKHALIVLVVKAILLSILGGAGAVLIVFRRPRAAVLGTATMAAVLVVTGAVGVVTFRSDAFSQPRFSGVLSSAPTLIGSVEDIPAKFDTYRRELAKIVTNITKLYDATTTLPGSISPDAIPVLFVSDIHDNPEAFTVMQSVVTQFGARAVVDTGDISDHGTAAENKLYDPVADLQIPYIYVRGNHDSSTTQAYLEKMPNVHVLDNGAVEEIAGIRWAGIGDPNFTPDQTVDYGHDGDARLAAAGQQLATAIDASSPKVDVALVHEPAMAKPLDGHVPLILDGHIHHRAHSATADTVTLTQGSSGGAGLRNLEGDEPLPLEMSVLYFDPVSHTLLAADEITLSGLGLESVQIQRHRAAYYRQDAKPEQSTPSSPGAPS